MTWQQPEPNAATWEAQPAGQVPTWPAIDIDALYTLWDVTIGVLTVWDDQNLKQTFFDYFPVDLDYWDKQT